jgi:hypothetical protein
LAPLFYQTGAHDQMYCVAAALVYLGYADPRLASVYENFRTSQMSAAAGKMNEELWRKILHPSEDPYIGALLALLAPAIAMSTANPHKALNLDRANRVDLAGPAWPYAAALRYVANIIEAPLPDVFLKNDAPGTVSIVNLKDKNTLTPALVVGPGFAQWTRQSEVIFDLAKRLVLMRSERFPRFALGTPALVEIALRAGLLLGGCPIGNGVHGNEVDKMAKTLDGLLTSGLRAELKLVAKKFVEARGDQLDPGRVRGYWRRRPRAHRRARRPKPPVGARPDPRSACLLGQRGSLRRPRRPRPARQPDPARRRASAGKITNELRADQSGAVGLNFALETGGLRSDKTEIDFQAGKPRTNALLEAQMWGRSGSRTRQKPVWTGLFSISQPYRQAWLRVFRRPADLGDGRWRV